MEKLQIFGFSLAYLILCFQNYLIKKVKNFCSFIELFCPQNSLIVGMQPQVSGKVGSLVGWLVFGWTMFGIPDDCRILPKG